MNKATFMAKYSLDKNDYENLLLYEYIRKDGEVNMWEYLGRMFGLGILGGEKLATLILKENFYKEFLQTLEEEK